MRTNVVCVHARVLWCVHVSLPTLVKDPHASACHLVPVRPALLSWNMAPGFLHLFPSLCFRQISKIGTAKGKCFWSLKCFGEGGEGHEEGRCRNLRGV